MVGCGLLGWQLVGHGWKFCKTRLLSISIAATHIHTYTYIYIYIYIRNKHTRFRKMNFNIKEYHNFTQ